MFTDARTLGTGKPGIVFHLDFYAIEDLQTIVERSAKILNVEIEIGALRALATETRLAREFVEELRAVSKSPVAYAELPHAQHAFDIFSSPRAHQSSEAVARFLSWVYASRMKKEPGA